MDELVAQHSKTRTVWLDMPVAFRVAYAGAVASKGQPQVYGSGRGVVRERLAGALVQRAQDPAALDQERLRGRARRHGVPLPLDSVLVEPGSAADAEGGPST